MLNEQGLLAEGIHDLSLAEIRERFGTFNGSDVRVRLFTKLADYVERASTFRWFRGILVDGSFVTAKQRPSDVDLILLVAADFSLEEMLKPAEYNIVSRRQARKLFGFDVIIATEGSAACDEWVEYFSRVKGSSERKGLVRLSSWR